MTRPVGNVGKKIKRTPHYRSGETMRGCQPGNNSPWDDFQRLQNFVEELHASDNETFMALSPNPAEVQEALCFFASHKAAKLASRTEHPGVPVRYILKLLHMVECHYRIPGSTSDTNVKGEWIQNCIFHSASSCFSLVMAMKRFLQPFKGIIASKRFNYDDEFGAVRQRRHKDMNMNAQEQEMIDLLRYATRTNILAQDLIRDASCPNIRADIPYCLAALELWKARCWYLGRQSSTWNTMTADKLTNDVRQEAFEVGSAEECLHVMSKLIQQMDAFFGRPNEDAYIIYINALSESGLDGAAQRARQALHDFETRQKPFKSALYNSTMKVCF